MIIKRQVKRDFLAFDLIQDKARQTKAIASKC